jgi:hypothetical protein
MPKNCGYKVIIREVFVKRSHIFTLRFYVRFSLIVRMEASAFLLADT